QIGDPQTVYRRPKSKIVADFIGETNFIEGKVLDSTADGAARVETSLGIFHGVVSDSAWRPLTGESATLSVRPECWRIELAKPAQNAASGRIGESIYLGEVAQYEFQTAGTPLKIFELNPDLTRRPLDRELYATADPDDVVVLRK
ncbi:MAG TPA: TOBE domain-containing protein, partial [Chthoniobacterales bacterium]|nr:TOBE domain-containing protein [Chthoniobacterales bacterium]